MKKIYIGMLGCGTVGTGVANILIRQKALIESRLGASLILKHVADIDIARDRGLSFDEGVLITNAQKVVDDPKIDIVVEMIGSEGVAKDLIIRAIKNGKHIVTANKALLAVHGYELFKATETNHIDLAFEASVGGCMPIIKSLRESLIANKIMAMTGILNGTCNFILSKITADSSTFQEALAIAQAKGFAETDPALDVEGFDTAHKLAILNALAYGMEINYNDVYIEGITQITPLDIAFARQFGYKIKLLAISKNRGDAVEARVHPAMIPFDNLLSEINGSLNAITVAGDAAGDIILYGHGAGMMPTASAVVSDIVDLARNLLNGTTGRVPALSFQTNAIKNIPVLPIDKIRTHYYFRFAAIDRPGVLSKITGVLGNHNISIKSVHQKGRKTDGVVPIVMLTHIAQEASVKKALVEISALEIVSGKPVLIRIEDKNGEDNN